MPAYDLGSSMALALSGAEEVTAYSTLALAALTFLLVITAAIAAMLAKRSIATQLHTAAQDLQATREATYAAQAAAERQLEASRRPLLIDVAPDGPVYADMGAEKHLSQPQRDVVMVAFPGGLPVLVDPRSVYVGQTPGRLHVMVPLRNAGNGLAVLEAEGIRAIGAATRRLMGCDVQRERVPPGETTRVLCSHEIAVGEARADKDIYELAVPYRDLAGGQATVALVRVEQIQESHWRLRDVRQVKPEDLGPELRSQPAAT